MSGMLVVAGAATLAGCGDGRLSHGDFVKRADAICSAFRASTPQISRPRTYEQIVASVNKTLPLYEAARRKLAELKPPKKDAAQVSAWLAADKRIAAALHDLGAAGLRHDFAGVTAAAAAVQSEGVASRHAAAALGLRVCSQA